jgi:hypothetical protein
MTAPDAGTPGIVTGFRLDQLKEAFERVCDPRNWRAPIRAVIPAVDRLLVEKAVRWYAETEPRFEEVPGDGMLLTVVAPGYRGSWTGESPGSTHSTENRKTI